MPLFAPTIGTTHVRSWHPLARAMVLPRPCKVIRSLMQRKQADIELTLWVENRRFRQAWDEYEQCSFKAPFQPSDRGPADTRASKRELARAQGRLAGLATKLYKLPVLRGR